jgi:phosphonate transport system ATP-binding protein
MLTIQKLGKSYAGKPALAGVSVEIERGAFVGVIGRSGAGKSTLLRCINRLVDPSEGRILFEGRDVTRLKGRALRQWRASCGMIFQQFNLAGRLDVLSNVLMGRIGSVGTFAAMIMAREGKACSIAGSRQARPWGPGEPARRKPVRWTAAAGRDRADTDAGPAHHSGG